MSSLPCFKAYDIRGKLGDVPLMEEKTKLILELLNK